MPRTIKTFRRYLVSRLREALTDTPVVLIHGPRQSGNGLRKLKEAAGKRFRAGVVLYDGDVTAPFGEGLYAVPISYLWEAA